jgi:threonine dehydrogenase-like Zn-dependent dehydrogenase
MRVAVLYGPHDFRIEERPQPEIRDDECLVRVRACGVCHSEIHQWEVKEEGLDYPRYIGHEVAGEVIEVGTKVEGYKRGDRVAVWTDRQGYAEMVAVKTDRLFPIAPEIPFDHALAEPIACATNGVLRANVQLADSVALVGTGFMGLILLQELKLRGPSQIIAIDIREQMLGLAKQLDATVIINPQKENVVQKIKRLTDNRGVDVAFEVGGAQATLDLAAELCRMEGKLVIFGYHPGPRQIKNLGFWNWMAFDIVNAHFRDLNTILRGARIGMALLNTGKIEMAPLITHKYPLDKIEAAFTAAKEKPRGFVKSVIIFN